MTITKNYTITNTYLSKKLCLNKKECNRLLKDLLKAGAPLNLNHYLDSVILKRREYKRKNKNNFLIIDSNIKIICENVG